MKIYFSTLLAILTVFILGGIVFFIFVVALTTDNEIRIQKNSYLEISLKGNIPFFETKREIDELLNKKRSVSVHDIVFSLKNASYDDQIKGILIKINFFSTSFGHLQEIKSAIREFKDVSDKPVYAYIETAGNREYYLAESADSIFMEAEGMLSLTPLQLNRDYYSETLSHFGIKADFIPIGKYKSAPEMFTRKDMSENSREQAKELLVFFQETFYNDIKANRNFSDAQFEKILDTSWFSSYQAKKLNLIDDLVHLDQLKNKLKHKSSNYRSISISKYRNISIEYPVDRNNQFAIINTDGAIMSGEDGTNPMTGKSMGAERVIRNIRSAVKRKKIKGIILRINSPGGAVLASDKIWREIKLARKKKPVFASIGGMAASGGYYMAIACEQIIAESTSIVGSIGVFMGKFNLNGFRKDWLKINIDRILLDKKRDYNYFNINRSFTKEERQILTTSLNEFYHRFVNKVASARKMNYDDAHKVAQGRVWTGFAGKKIGLVDTLGNLQLAIKLLMKKLDIDKRPALSIYPKTISLFDDISNSPIIYSKWKNVNTFMETIKSIAKVNQWALIPFSYSIM